MFPDFAHCTGSDLSLNTCDCGGAFALGFVWCFVVGNDSPLLLLRYSSMRTIPMHKQRHMYGSLAIYR